VQLATWAQSSESRVKKDGTLHAPKVPIGIIKNSAKTAAKIMPASG
jgi:hypothetical protein